MIRIAPPVTGVFAAIAAALVLNACSPRPYQVAPAKAVARAAGPESARLIGICYGNALNTPEQVLEEARFICGGEVEALRATDMVWTPCGLLQPTRATFVCKPKAGS